MLPLAVFGQTALFYPGDRGAKLPSCVCVCPWPGRAIIIITAKKRGRERSLFLPSLMSARHEKREGRGEVEAKGSGAPAICDSRRGDHKLADFLRHVHFLPWPSCIYSPAFAGLFVPSSARKPFILKSCAGVSSSSLRLFLLLFSFPSRNFFLFM